jgi:iron only hydrogenase large subunit-like protein
VAISPQSISSVTEWAKRKLGMTEANDFDTFRRLQTLFLTNLGADMVLEMSLFTGLALDLAYKEFQERFIQCGKSPVNSEGEEQKSNIKFHKRDSGMPVIASECPGWVCYAEKRVGDMAVGHMSSVKSPQQLCGALTKLHYA